MTRTICLFSSNVSYSLTTLGCLNRRRISVSRRTFSCYPSSLIRSLFIDFTATNFLDNRCFAKFTFPKAPFPSTFPTRYQSREVGGAFFVLSKVCLMIRVIPHLVSFFSSAGASPVDSRFSSSLLDDEELKGSSSEKILSCGCQCAV